MEDFIIYDTLDSTNLEAHRLVQSHQARHGLTIMALHQTHGRGQRGRQWSAEKESHLALTIILLPEHSFSSLLAQMSMKISLAIVMALQQLEPHLSPKIKWPNDIYLHDKKVCGLLLENTLSGQRITSIIAGIGVNVNESQFSPDLPHAISLRMATGRKFDRMEVAKLIRQLILAMMESRTRDWKTDYDQYIYGLAENIHVELEGTSFKAKHLGIDREGRIRLQRQGYDIESYYAHQIKWLI